MKQPIWRRPALFIISMIVIAISYGPVAAKTEYRVLQLKDKTKLDYAIIAPDNVTVKQELPILLALPPGPQHKGTVDWGLNNIYKDAAENGWVVISPVAPNGRLFFSGSEKYIPELLAHVADEFQPEGGKFHIAGISNGGISTFRIVLNSPEMFQSVIALPGFPRGNDFHKLSLLKDKPVRMFVGEHDTGWVEAMQRTQRELAKLGADVELEIVAGSGHQIEAFYDGKKLFALLDSFRRKEKVN